MTTTTTTRFSVFRSSVRLHATQAIGELKKLEPLKPHKVSLVKIQNSTLHSNVLLGFPHMIEVREMTTYLPACRLLPGLAAAEEGSSAWQRAALTAAGRQANMTD